MANGSGGGGAHAENVAGTFNLARILVFLVCDLSMIAVVATAASAGVPTVISPLPMPIIIPMFIGFPFAIIAAIPVGMFFVMLWPITRNERGPIPMRASILFVIATALSALWHVAGWSYGVQYEGFDYTVAVEAISFGSIIGLWFLWAFTRRDPSFGWRIIFGTLLLYLLFWYAFPYLGELP